MLQFTKMYQAAVLLIHIVIFWQSKAASRIWGSNYTKYEWIVSWKGLNWQRKWFQNQYNTSSQSETTKNNVKSIEMIGKINFKLFFSLFKLKQIFLSKNPHEKWIYVRRFNIFLMEFIGCQFMEANYVLHFQTWVQMYISFNYFTLLIYTLFYYRNDPFRALQATPMCGLMIPVSASGNI